MTNPTLIPDTERNMTPYETEEGTVFFMWSSSIHAHIETEYVNTVY